MLKFTQGIMNRGQVTTDADVVAFLTATGISDSTQTSALYALVASAKSNGWWTKCLAIYPMVGGNATAHSYNLRNTSNYRITFQGGPTHSSTGIAWNTGQYGQTALVPNADLTLNDTHLSYYSRSNTSNNGVEIGSRNSANINYLTLAVYYSPLSVAISEMYYGGTTDGELQAATSNSQGYFISSRTASNNFFLAKNGTSINSISTTGGALPDVEIYIGAYNAGGTPSNYSTRECAFATIGSGIDSTLAATMYTDIQNFQTTLSRQV